LFLCALKEWLTVKDAAKRRMVEIAFLNCRIGDVTFALEMRKPFDLLAEGLLSEKSRGDKTPLELFIAGVQGWEAGLRRRFDNSKSNPS
jgi:hypothetical protein